MGAVEAAGPGVEAAQVGPVVVTAGAEAMVAARVTGAEWAMAPDLGLATATLTTAFQPEVLPLKLLDIRGQLITDGRSQPTVAQAT